MKTFVTWNLRGLESQWGNLLLLMEETQADFICLQEHKKKMDWILKNKPNDYDVLAVEDKRNSSYGGTAIYYREQANIKAQAPLKDLTAENIFMRNEGRFLILMYDNYCVINCYLPDINGETEDVIDKKSRNKFAGFGYIDYMCKIMAHIGKNVILCGDVNVGRYYKYISGRKGNIGKHGFMAWELELFRKLKAGNGLVDTLSYCHDEKYLEEYFLSCGFNSSYFNNLYTLDYILVNERLANRIHSVEILYKYGHQGESHMPLKVVLDI